MSEIASGPVKSRLQAVLTDDQRDAFRKAGRHTKRVKWLRRLVLYGSIGLCLAVGAIAFNPFRGVLPGNLSIAEAGLDGTRVTMARPKMSGYHQDGRPYDFIARTAVQDLRTPNVLELNVLDAHLTMSDKGVAHITADTGVYDSTLELMDLKGHVHVTSTTGYDITMSAAHIEFKGGNVVTKEPLNVIMQGGTIAADAMHMVDNGKEITFEGHVHSLFLAPADTKAAPTEIKGTAQ